MRLFDRKPPQAAEIFAEAQALVDDGLDLDFVLELYAEHREWLAELLDTSAAMRDAVAAEPPSYYFEASLKAKVLAAGAAMAREAQVSDAPLPPAFIPAPEPGAFASVRAALAGLTVVGTAAALGIVTLGFVTAGTAGPGDWNYGLKMAQERLQYTLSSGDQRVDVQLRQTEARVYELQRQAAKGDVSAADIERLRREANELAQLAKGHELDEVQKARLKSIGEQTNVVLSDVRQRQVALEPKVDTAIETVNSAMVSAGIGAAQPLPTPAATATATPAATSTPVPTETPVTPTAVPTETATPTPPPPTETPTPTPTEEPSPSPSPSPSPTESATPAATPTP